MELAIEIQDLVVEFTTRHGRMRAVDGLNLSVPRGHVFGFIGPNGAGKTTTIHALLGFIAPSAGSLRVLGGDVRRAAARRRIGYMSERPEIYRFLSGRELLCNMGQLFNMSAAVARRRAGVLLGQVGLAEAADRLIAVYSRGMLQRLGLAQALMNDPELVILDEPTSGLDPIGCREVKDLIIELARRGKTVILSSHLLADVEDVCDRVVIYYGGKIQAMGTLKELLSTPDQLRITVPVLERETLEKVLATIRADLTKKLPESSALESVTVDSPTQNLESYFLDVVKKARSSAEETSGAVSGGAVADYLRSEDSERVQAKDRILERLLSSKETAPAPAPEKLPEEEEKPAVAAASEKLSALLSKAAPKQEPAEAEEAPAATESAERRESLKKAGEKLSGLLGKKENK